jgi:hypothetical protein
MPTIKANLNRITGALDRIIAHAEEDLAKRSTEIKSVAEQKINEMLEKVAVNFENFEEQLEKEKKKQN